MNIVLLWLFYLETHGILTCIYYCCCSLDYLRWITNGCPKRFKGAPKGAVGVVFPLAVSIKHNLFNLSLFIRLTYWLHPGWKFCLCCHVAFAAWPVHTLWGTLCHFTMQCSEILHHSWARSPTFNISPTVHFLHARFRDFIICFCFFF